VNRPRAADDFATIRARMEDLRRERYGTKPSDKEAQRNPPMPPGGAIRCQSLVRAVLVLLTSSRVAVKTRPSGREETP